MRIATRSPFLRYPMRAVTEFLRNPHARIRVPPVVAYLNTALTGRRQPTAALPAVVNGSNRLPEPGKGETSSRLPAFSLFLPGTCPNTRDRRRISPADGLA
jgi:hypothetical protein